jgi:hypothetical protein
MNQIEHAIALSNHAVTLLAFRKRNSVAISHLKEALQYMKDITNEMMPLRNQCEVHRDL